MKTCMAIILFAAAIVTTGCSYTCDVYMHMSDGSLSYLSEWTTTAHNEADAEAKCEDRDVDYDCMDCTQNKP
jgi:hypothetical protein